MARKVLRSLLLGLLLEVALNGEGEDGTVLDVAQGFLVIIECLYDVIVVNLLSPSESGAISLIVLDYRFDGKQDVI